MSKLVCNCAEHALTSLITPRKVVAVAGIIITGLSFSYLLYRALKPKRVELDDGDNDDVLAPPIQEENGNYPVENEEVSWIRIRSWVASRTTCSRLKIRLVLEPKRIELITMALATQGFYKRFKFQRGVFAP